MGRSSTFTSEADSLRDLLDDIETRYPSLSHIPLSVYANGKKISGEDGLGPVGPLEVVSGLPGGKGGFGSMLRALGAQIEKTTNKDACRDLSGRRLRDINEEERLKNYVSRQAERDQKEAEKKEAKLNKLKRIANGENKHEFKDLKYNEERENATERVHDAMEHALKIRKEKDAAEPKAGTSGAVKRKAAPETPASRPVQNKKGLWMGVDLTDSDLESSSSDEEA